MDLRRLIFSPGMKLIRHPLIERLLADPRTMDLFIAATRAKTLLQTALTAALRDRGDRDRSQQ